MSGIHIIQITLGLKISEQNISRLSEDSQYQGAMSISECLNVHSVMTFLSTGNEWLFKTVLSLP